MEVLFSKIANRQELKAIAIEVTMRQGAPEKNMRNPTKFLLITSVKQKISMKNISILMLFLLGLQVLVAQEAIEVPNTQNSILTKKTAQWCPPCGGWAWDFFEDMIAENPANTLMISAQIPGGSGSATIKLESETSGAITTNFDNNTSRPLFFLNNDNQGVLSFNADEKKGEMLDKIESYAQQPPIVQSGILAEYTADSILVIKTNSRFFQPTTGVYRIGIYPVEKMKIADQAGQGSEGEHKNVLGQELTNNPFGLLLAEGNVLIDTQVERELTTPLNQLPELSNLIIATIIWEDLGDSYEIVNTNFTDSFSMQEEQMQDTTTTTTTTFVRSEVEELNLFPNKVLLNSNPEIQIEFILGRTYPSVDITAYDLTGRMIHTIYQGNLTAGAQQFTWRPASYLSKGLYLVKMEIGGEAVIRKVILE